MTAPREVQPTADRAVQPSDEAAGQEQNGTQQARPSKSTWRELPALIALSLILAFLIKTFLVQAFYIPSGSMLPALQVGDRVLVEKLSYRFREPERGEVIVFRRPGHSEPGFSPVATARSFLEGLGLVQPDDDVDLIKRVIGLPGETVELIDGVVHIDGQPLAEDYARPETRDFTATQVPEGHYFVLGDNRMNSLDSRFTLGMVPESQIVGRAFVILWPPSDVTLALDADYPAVGERAD